MTAQAVRLTNVDIDNALKNKHFEVIFQPIFQLKDGSFLRLEAFVRWVHPGLGTLPPGAFISFFESQGRMSELTRYVLETALDAYIGWRGKAGPGFSINLSLSDLTDETFPNHVRDLLLQHDFPPELVTLECPATQVDMPTKKAAEIFQRLKQIGVRLAIEVRGRATELMRGLDPFPFDEVKTGGSAILRFARTVRGGPGLGAISELLEIAKSNKADIVAVGVEDQASLRALNSLGFSAAQGNHLAKVGAIEAIRPELINEVREALAIDPLSESELAEVLKREMDPPSNAEEKNSPEETLTKAPKSTDAADPESEEQSVDDEEQAKRIAKAKILKARAAAKKRALKKAAEAKAAAEKARIELETRQNEIRKAEAQREVEESARKLQDRLNRAYDENDDDADNIKAELSKVNADKDESEPKTTSKTTKTTGKKVTAKKATRKSTKKTTRKKSTAKKTAAKKTTRKKADPKKTKIDDQAENISAASDTSLQENSPQDNAAPEAGLLLGGSLGATALNVPNPAIASSETEESLAPTPVDEKNEPATEETSNSQPDPHEESPTNATTPEQPPETKERDTSTSKADEAEAAEAAILSDGEILLSESAPSEALTVEMLVEETCPPLDGEDDSDIMSEDEELDRFFETSKELPHDQPQAPDDAPVDEALLELGLKDLAAPAKPARTRKKRNFLTRKYRVRITGFWPESWKEKWAKDKIERENFEMME